MRRVSGWAIGRLAAVVLLTAYPLNRLTGQADTTSARQASAPDTIHRLGPMGAFWRSLLLPGWGQAKLGRRVTGAAFVTWEGVTVMMTLKAQQEANYLKATGSDNLHAKRQEVQDWLVLWIFNHLFAGAEAYVSAHLQDFPPDLKLHAVPGGVGVRVPFRTPR